MCSGTSPPTDYQSHPSTHCPSLFIPLLSHFSKQSVQSQPPYQPFNQLLSRDTVTCDGRDSDISGRVRIRPTPCHFYQITIYTNTSLMESTCQSAWIIWQEDETVAT